MSLSSCVCPSRVIIGPCCLVIVTCVVVGPCCLIIVVACLVMSSLCLVLLVTLLCCPGRVIVQCHRPCLAMSLVHRRPVSEQGELGGTGNGGYSPWSPNNDDIICHLVATSPSVTWHLDPVSEKWMGGGELSHLGSSSPVSVRRCWPS